jgi:hypothetical protein
LQVGLSVDLLYLEFIQSDNLGLSAISGRQDHSGLFLVVGLNNYPCGVFPVHASPIGVSQVMGTGRKKNLDEMGTGMLIAIMRNFNEKSWHFLLSPF